MSELYTAVEDEPYTVAERMRIRSAWYWRRVGDDRPQAWEFLQWGRPNVWWLQRDYLEIRT